VETPPTNRVLVFERGICVQGKDMKGSKRSMESHRKKEEVRKKKRRIWSELQKKPS
jgi:hypothetical protein